MLTKVSAPMLMNLPRTIHLRRPPVLSVQGGVFLPANHLLEEVERRWHTLCQSNPAYFDGRLYHVLGVHRNGHGGATLHVVESAYRFFAVQDHQFDVGMRALGLKGITIRNDRVLMGRRSMNVAAYQGMWEFAPAGSAEPGKPTAEVIQQELLEETGLKSVREPTPLAMLFDPVLRCWEVVYRLHADDDDSPKPRTAEYTQLEWHELDELPRELSPIARQIAPLLATARHMK